MPFCFVVEHKHFGLIFRIFCHVSTNVYFITKYQYCCLLFTFQCLYLVCVCVCVCFSMHVCMRIKWPSKMHHNCSNRCSRPTYRLLRTPTFSSPSSIPASQASLMYKINNRGPKTEPCSTPDSTSSGCEEAPFSTTD